MLKSCLKEVSFGCNCVFILNWMIFLYVSFYYDGQAIFFYSHFISLLFFSSFSLSFYFHLSLMLATFFSPFILPSFSPTPSTLYFLFHVIFCSSHPLLFWVFLFPQWISWYFFFPIIIFFFIFLSFLSTTLYLFT